MEARFLMLCFPFAAAPLSLAGCNGSEPTPAARHPAQITIVAGDNQSAPLGTILPAPFAVRVTDDDGVPVPNIRVHWTLASGVGDFLSWRGNRLELLPESAPFTLTGDDGVAEVSFRPLIAGTVVVSATIDEEQLSSPPFAVEVEPRIGAEISFGPLFDCYPTPSSDTSRFEGPDRGSDVVVLVGETVQWVYADWLPAVCTSRIVSRSGPPDGRPIDSGILGPGSGFRFVPEVAGTWVFTDAINGGSGTLTARAP
jgi:hypothetical protein